MVTNNKISDYFSIYDRAEKSISEFSNWLFGISSAQPGFLLLLIGNNNISFDCKVTNLATMTLAWTMLNSLFIGYTKYRIHIRQISMATKMGLIIKSNLLVDDSKSNKNDISQNINNWFTEHNKIKTISKLLDISIFTSVITILIIGSFIIFKINH
jgi:hypothetical protein